MKIEARRPVKNHAFAGEHTAESGSAHSGAVPRPKKLKARDVAVPGLTVTLRY